MLGVSLRSQEIGTEVRGQHERVGSILPLSGSRGLKSGGQVWRQATSTPFEPSGKVVPASLLSPLANSPASF